jgi:hypothetical protein
MDVSPEFQMRLSSELAKASKLLTKDEAKYLVGLYYTMQENRKATGNAIGAINRRQEESSSLLTFFNEQQEALEYQIKSALNKFSLASPWGQWLRSIHGIGPVITAGFVSNFDITKAPTAGSMLRFAGQDPTCVWKKGEKRPYNAQLKVLCYHAGTSFIKFRASKKDMYGRLYDTRKNYEITRNNAGELADQAKAKLENFNFSRDTTAKSFYEKGMLPPAHINSRVRRWMLRLFISHAHEVAYYLQYGSAGPRPYANEYLPEQAVKMLGHAHVVAPPNIDKIAGMTEALNARAPFVPLEKYISMLEARWGVAPPSNDVVEEPSDFEE